MLILRDISFAVTVAQAWIEGRDREESLSEIADGDVLATLTIRNHFQRRITARIRRVEE